MDFDLDVLGVDGGVAMAGDEACVGGGRKYQLVRACGHHETSPCQLLVSYYVL
jgi:hypothetical protein